MSRLLAIDDDRNNLALVNATIKKYIPECKVFLAASGEEGIAKVKKHSPDVILLDVMMPVMNGYEVCEILKSDELTRHIPIIFFSAYVKDSEGIVKGLQLGADAFLKKPINPSELAAQVKVMLRIRKVEDGLRKEMQKYWTMAETMPDAVFTIDMNDKLTYLSPKAFQLFKLEEAKSYLKQNVFDLVFPGCYEQARQFFNGLLINYINKDVEFVLKKANQEVFTAEISASLITDDKDEPLEYIFVVRDISERKMIAQKFADYQKNLKSLNALLTRTEETERRNIAEYIHDGIAQILSLAYINLSTVTKEGLPKEDQETLSTTLNLIDNAITETRSLTFNLSPPILFELGLVPALKWKLEQVSKKHGCKTEFQSEDAKIDVGVNSRTLLYRIVSELINNVIKHAEAEKIMLHCSIKEGNLNLAVSDNGKGFNYVPESRVTEKSGFGFFSIKERLESIQGEMLVRSEKGKGTIVTIIIPQKNL